MFKFHEIDPAHLATLEARARIGFTCWSAQDYAAILAQPHAICVANHWSFAIGRVIAGLADLDMLVTDPQFQNQGIGQKTLRSFLNLAVKKGAERCILEVAEHNIAARALYDRFGFVQVHRRKAYYTGPKREKIDALVLQCALVS